MRRSYIRSSRKKTRQSINPMESVVNLIDIMLIFACGLMISIVSLWHVDLNANPTSNQGNSYQNMGQVYEDPVTHKMYIIKTQTEDNTTDSTNNNSSDDSGGEDGAE